MRYCILKLNACNAIVLSVATLFFCGHSVAWQADPFDPFTPDETEVQDTATETSDTTELPPIEDTLSDGVKLVVKSVRDANPSTPQELARAVNTLLNVRQYAEAKVYLQKLINSSLNDMQTFELMSQMGPDFFLVIRDQAELQPEGNEFAMQAFAASKRAAFSPQRIANLVGLLSDDDRFIRAEAISSLRQLGAPAAAEMINRCADKNNSKQTPYILSALKQMGSEAMLPMLGAVRIDGSIAQAVAVSVLAGQSSPIATDALGRAAISNRVPPSVRTIAAAAVAQQNLRSTSEIEQRLKNRTRMYLEGDVELPADSRGQITLWHWDYGKNRLLPITVSQKDAAALLAVDLARDAYRLNPRESERRQLQILSVLEATKRVIGPNREMYLRELQSYVPDATAFDIDQALGKAMDDHYIAAAIAACELLGEFGDESVVASANQQPRNLVQAILHGNRHLQFAAANAIRKIDPKQSYPGSSYFAKFMTFLSQSAASRTGVVAHRRPAAAQRLASFVGQSGLQSRVAFSPESLVAELNTNPDIELVVLTDSFSHPHYLELVQQVRKNWLTKALPIGLFVSNDERRRQAELMFADDPLTIVSPLTSSPKLIYDQVQRLLARQRPWSISNPQRDFQNDVAIQWLNDATQEPSKYGFYHLACYRDQLARLLGTDDNWELKSNIVSNVATPDAQRELVNLASQAGLPLDERQMVAAAFERSVKKNGLLLTSSEILEQYQRYNASEKQGVESQNILSSILDTIEAKSRQQ